MSFGSYLKKQRETNKWTAKDIADRLGFSASYVSQLENDARLPSQKQLSLLAKAYEVSEDELRKQWTESKIQKVSLSSNYKINIKDAGEKRVEEMTHNLEAGLAELKKTITADEVAHYKMPLFSTIPVDDLDLHLKHADEFIFIPKNGIVRDHRIFGIRVSITPFPEAGIIAGDLTMLDADIEINDGDIVVLSTPDGLVMTYYKKRGNSLEITTSQPGIKKTYPVEGVKPIGRLIYHIKKY
ncbi:MAG: helix-turn-helix domain-containing protein [Patescibacteria group bacterium]